MHNPRGVEVEAASEHDVATPPTTIVRTPSKSRSLSDSTPKLSPSPRIKEYGRTIISKDDHNISSPNPRTPRRPDFLNRGLSLQMPPRDSLGIQTSSGSGVVGSANLFAKAPLSPQIDKSHTYASPAKVLPRHSRGLDFSRACTNLHHSTLAEQSSPDSSPTITQKGVMIPSRKMSINSMALDPPHFAPWIGNNGNGPAEKSVVSSSLGSVNMLGSDSSSSSDDDMEPMEPMEPDEAEEPILTTPQVHKRSNPSASTPFGAQTVPYGSNWAAISSPGAGNFTNFHRQRLRNGRSRKSSSSASGHSSLASPAPASPPGGKADGNAHIPREVNMRGPTSRRESLSMHTHDLHISSGNDSGDEAGMPAPSTPAVVRRAVTRRGNLLPKIRALGRVRAELLEETMPVDAEVKREAEVIRQVRESDPNDTPSGNGTTHSSPTMQAVNNLAEALEGIPEDNAMSLDNAASMNGGGFTGKGLFGTFARRQSSSANGGKEFWNTPFEHRTPPPPTFYHRGSSSVMSDDVSMDSPTISTFPSSMWGIPTTESANNSNGHTATSSRGSTPQPQLQPLSQCSSNSNTTLPHQPPSAADGLRKVNKRRRDDDLDMQSIKRRAVSPGVSVGNSPILSQSPSQRSENMWGQQNGRGSSSAGASGGAHERAGSVSQASNGGGSVQQTPLLGPKRVGLQGMNDMQGLTEKMSIE
ncbi:hypothetical protein EJ08DRAFT_668540 [Tothia fuscella]|uniref:Uncharacterized protein n=1 Tax=Tothia fuscella TaxID=1048955 RepID=A0A9P4P0B3_9PEZI|nr:hypothetical protein EJ08DRAFT_668540 [Tothia fuscella]